MKYRRAIYVELRDVHSTLKTRLEGIRRAMAEFLTHRKITALPSEIEFPIYEKWFVEVVLQFTESERLAYSHIYQKLRHLNWQFAEQQQLWDVFSSDKEKNKENLRKTVMLMEAAFINAGTVDLMISHLLRYKESYDIRDTELEALIYEREKALEQELHEMLARASNASSEKPVAMDR
jgi:hypothetical protein